MTATKKREKLFDYIKAADEKKINAIYTVLEKEIEDNIGAHWDDEDVLQELELHSRAYTKGDIGSITWSKAKTKLLKTTVK